MTIKRVVKQELIKEYHLRESLDQDQFENFEGWKNQLQKSDFDEMDFSRTPLKLDEIPHYAIDTDKCVAFNDCGQIIMIVDDEDETCLTPISGETGINMVLEQLVECWEVFQFETQEEFFEWAINELRPTESAEPFEDYKHSPQAEYKVTVEQDNCIICGACESICSEVFGFDIDDVTINQDKVSDNIDDVREARDCCPFGCIKLEKV